MKTKIIIMLVYLGAILLSSQITLAQDWGIGGGINSEGDWSLGVGIGSGGSGIGGLGGSSSGLPSESILGIVQNILYWLLGILSAVALIGFIISGIMYLTAAGDETQAGKAKKAMLYSIIGVIVGLSGFVIYQAAMYMLNGQSF